jgi:hypothetical protein
MRLNAIKFRRVKQVGGIAAIRRRHYARDRDRDFSFTILKPLGQVVLGVGVKGDGKSSRFSRGLDRIGDGSEILVHVPVNIPINNPSVEPPFAFWAESGVATVPAVATTATTSAASQKLIRICFIPASYWKPPNPYLAKLENFRANW